MNEIRLLTEGDRQFILTQLKNAPDSVLADAMLAFNAIRDKVVQIRKMTTPDSAPEMEELREAGEHMAAQKIVDRRNVDPGKSSITKIGGDTKLHILHNLNSGIQPGTKYVEHAKLLWSRGEVKFDGKEYYL